MGCCGKGHRQILVVQRCLFLRDPLSIQKKVDMERKECLMLPEILTDMEASSRRDHVSMTGTQHEGIFLEECPFVTSDVANERRNVV